MTLAGLCAPSLRRFAPSCKLVCCSSGLWYLSQTWPQTFLRESSSDLSCRTRKKKQNPPILFYVMPFATSNWLKALGWCTLGMQIHLCMRRSALLAACEQEVTRALTSRDTDAVQLLILGALGSASGEVCTPKWEESWGNLLRQGAVVFGVGMNFFRQIEYLHRCCFNLSHCVQIAN